MAEASGDARMVSAGVAGAACRINDLPSHLLCLLISFLNARQLVQTCVLSRRWRDLWRSVPRINASRLEFDELAGTWVEQNVPRMFDDDEFDAITEEAGDMLFRRFMNRFLMLRNPVPLDEFRLGYNRSDGSVDPIAGPVC